MSRDLSKREAEVLALVAGGYTNKLIATQLGISSHTVKFHMGNVMRKVGADTRAEAAAIAVRMGVA